MPHLFYEFNIYGYFCYNLLCILGKYQGPGKGLASRACNWYIHSRMGYRISMNIEFFSVEGDPPGKCYLISSIN